MPKFGCHLFVCCNRREPGHSRGCCDPDGSEHLRNCFKAALKRYDFEIPVRANASGCLDQCELGPTVVIYPQQIWYGHVTPDDVPRIIEETILGGRILPDLLIDDAWLNTKGRGPVGSDTTPAVPPIAPPGGSPTAPQSAAPRPDEISRRLDATTE